jgi:hypothetical protein
MQQTTLYPFGRAVVRKARLDVRAHLGRDHRFRRERYLPSPSTELKPCCAARSRRFRELGGTSSAVVLLPRLIRTCFHSAGQWSRMSCRNWSIVSMISLYLNPCRHLSGCVRTSRHHPHAVLPPRILATLDGCANGRTVEFNQVMAR